MSDPVVTARDLTKVYRLYAKPHYRLLDMFGLLPPGRDRYTEHRALDRVNLEIRGGERVAVIGRNGAGKSTLLKLATKVIEPTSGHIEVAPGAHVLLQIGTGFHPDFTGRENAYSYLAHIGITGAEADRRVLEIVDFAELEEYMDQPIKTYSTGMAARLMFATSTTIKPSLLVLDEVLGVGDAYFAQKSYERIRELCRAEGTTVLLVSHDVYSASRLCERMIWIDRGQIRIDGPSVPVIKAYETAVREQEEARLRAKKALRLDALAPASAEAGVQHFRLELCSVRNRPLPKPIHFSRIALRRRDGHELDLPLTASEAQDVAQPHLELSDGCWGEIEFWEGRPCRPMRSFGSPFHKVSGAFLAPGLVQDGELDAGALLLEYWAEQATDISLHGYLGRRELELGSLPREEGSWASLTIPIGAALLARAAIQVDPAGFHGTGDIVITDVKALDRFDRETHGVLHGEPLSIVVSYEIRRPGLREKPQLLLAFLRDGIHDVCRVISRELVFDAAERRVGSARVFFQRLGLTDGAYAISVILAKEGYYDRPQSVFFSINPDVYSGVSRAVEFVVGGAGPVGSGTGVITEASWDMLERDSKPPDPGARS